MRASHVSFRAIGFYVITLSMMVLLFGLSIRLGTYTLSFEEIWAAFQPDDKNYFTLMEYRLPRAVLAILLGGALAISGVLVQSVVRNPLASPDILGINNAAGLVAVSVLMFLPNLAFYWMPIFAFLGGVLLSFVILWIVCGFNFRPIKMAIIGVALSALWAAISHYLMLTNPVEINTAMLWLTGSLWGRSWSYLNVVLPWLVVLLPLPFIFCRDLDTLGLGENKASTLGVTVNKVQISVLVLAVALSTTAVAICGPIAFLGLVAPHLARRLVGGRHRTLLPAALIIGALLLQLSDILARVIDPPTELPAGILTAIIGAPYFFYLLMRTK